MNKLFFNKILAQAKTMFIDLKFIHQTEYFCC